MASPYKLTLNNGNENLGITKQTITANEDPRVATIDQLATEIVHLCPLAIDKKLVTTMLSYMGEATVNLISQGWQVPFVCNGKTIWTAYTDIYMKDTFDLDEAKRRGFTGTTMTEECFSLVNSNDIAYRAYVEQTASFTEALRATGEGIRRSGTEVKAKILKKGTSGSSTSGTSGTQTPPSFGD